jgi:septal ring factor EnvC (AmiA/AmiB activator)
MENIMKQVKTAFHALLIVGMMGWMSACDNNRKNDTADKTNTNEAYETDADAETYEMGEDDASVWMRERDDMVTRQREMSNRIDRDLKTYESKMASIDNKSRKAMQESINSLRIKRDNLDNKIEQMENATADSWAEMKQDVTEAGTELENTWDAFDNEYSTRTNRK